MLADLDRLWESATVSAPCLSPVASLPPVASRYLNRALPAGPLAQAVRLKMHGEIKLGKWRSFTAEQVIHQHRGMIWSARVRMGLLWVSGFDRVIDGQGAMEWKLLGLVPFLKTSGRDTTISSIGRAAAEFCWLPSALVGARWTDLDTERTRAEFAAFGMQQKVTLTVAQDGTLRAIQLKRWGKDRRPFGLVDFGGYVDESMECGGYTVPHKVRIGWHFGPDGFENDGEFFRGIVDAAVFRPT